MASRQQCARCAAGAVQRGFPLPARASAPFRTRRGAHPPTPSPHAQVGSKRWRVDVRGRQDATLHLSSVNLSGGVQRRRTFEDALNMRSLFKEEDVISAEVHSVFADGSIALHARSLKYGKLENGDFMAVAPGLVTRLKQHFVSLPCGVDLILGLNGFVWITESVAALAAAAGGALSKMPIGPDGAMLDVEDAAAAEEGLAEAIEKMKAFAAERVRGEGRCRVGWGPLPAAAASRRSRNRSQSSAHTRTPSFRPCLLPSPPAPQTIDAEARTRMARVRNALAVLSAAATPIEPATIMLVYDAAEAAGLPPAHMLHPEHAAALLAAASSGGGGGGRA